MPYIKVKIDRFDDYEREVEKCNKRISKIKTKFAEIGKKLDWDVKNRKQINRQITIIRDDYLSPAVQATSRMMRFLDDALKEYKKVDASIEELLDIIQKTNLQKQEERQKLIDGIEIGLAVVFGIATVAATACGLGPVAMLSLAAAQSVLDTTVDHLGETYVETGEAGIQDWGEYGKDVVVNGIVDVGVEYIGGKWISNKAGDALEGAMGVAKSAWGRAGQKFISETGAEMISNTATGGAKRYIEAYGDCFYDSVTSGKSVLDSVKDSNAAGVDAALDKEAFYSDIILAAPEGLGAAGGAWVEDKLGQTVLQSGFYSKDKTTRVRTAAVQGMAKKATEGILERGADESLKSALFEHDFDLQDVGEAMFDPTKIAKDVLMGAAKAGRKEADKEIIGFRVDMSDYEIIDFAGNKLAGTPESEANRYADATGYATEMAPSDNAKYTEWLKKHEPQNPLKSR